MQSRPRIAGRLAVAILLVSAAAGPAAQTGGAPQVKQVRRDAREVGDAFIGRWVLNVEKSTFNGPALKAATRTFDYTGDGKYLITYEMVNAKDERSFGHWIVQLNGTGIEWTRQNGSTAMYVADWKVVDPQNIDITAYQNGRQVWTGQFSVSEDGKTLKWTLKTARGGQTQWIYDKG